MTYSELIDRISEQTGLTKKDAGELLKEMFLEMGELLEQGNGFLVPELGTFRTELKEVRKVYSPHHERMMLIPPRKVVHFSVGKNLREKLKFTHPEQ